MILSSAEISSCGLYRYSLTRVWDSSRGIVAFIMLNPSTADASLDDPTIRRCMAFSKAWGFGAIYVGNLFAFRATEPKAMLAAPDPIGPENDAWLLKIAKESDRVICAWGAHGKHRGRSIGVRAMMANAHIQPFALRLTNTGEPGHPLYIPGDTEPVAF